MRLNELIMIKVNPEENILYNVDYLLDYYEDENNTAESKDCFYEVIRELLDMAGNHGFYGNLWHCYLANLLVNNENPYSRSTEVRGEIEGSINQAILHDMEIIKAYMELDFEEIAQTLEVKGWDVILDYQASSQESKIYNTRIKERICSLAKKLGECSDASEMKDILTQFYKEYGVGKFGLHKAFRIDEINGETVIEPILNIAHVQLEDLVGYDIQKKKLTDNTDAFVAGKKANNCLLYGDAGTGKSTSIKAITNTYYEKGLRVIEVYKHQFKLLNDVIAQIKNRNYKFIIYMDDLSFEDFEIEYKYLKAVIEGGLEKKPDNVLIYATSNKRHLVNETFSEREDNLHARDAMQEKLSLVARFGVTIYYGSPDKKEFNNIVKVLAERTEINLDEDALLLEANKWEMSHMGYSGRSARQLVDYLKGLQ